jgi:hypothetical protein
MIYHQCSHLVMVQPKASPCRLDVEANARGENLYFCWSFFLHRVVDVATTTDACHLGKPCVNSRGILSTRELEDKGANNTNNNEKMTQKPHKFELVFFYCFPSWWRTSYLGASSTWSFAPLRHSATK